MLKTTSTFKARDTSSAMEKVISKLGDDCVILSTKKKNGMIEITASNLMKHKSAVKKRYDKEKFSNIYKIKAGKLKINKDSIKELAPTDAKSKDINIEIINKIIKRENNIILEKIDKKLENIYLTDFKNISKILFFLII